MSPQLAGWPAQKRLRLAQPNPTRPNPTLVADTRHWKTPISQAPHPYGRGDCGPAVSRPPTPGPVFSTPHSRDPRVLAQRPHR